MIKDVVVSSREHSATIASASHRLSHCNFLLQILFSSA